MTKEITYTVVKGIDVASAMKASSRQGKAERTAKKAAITVWEQTVSICMEGISVESVSNDTTKEGIEALQQILKTVVTNYIVANTEIPTRGINDRTGKEFDVRDDSGLVKWSSWDETRRMMDYTGAVAKILAHGHADKLYPEQFTVGARGQCLALCKDNDPLSHITRLCKDLQGYADVIDAKQSVEAHGHIMDVSINDLDSQDEAIALIGQLNKVIGGLDTAQKQAVASALITLAQKLN